MPRAVSATATTTSAAAPDPSPVGSLPGASGSSSHASHAECCGHLKAELQRHLDHAENHQTLFWHYLMWNTSNLNAHQRSNMEREVLEVVMRRCMNTEPAIPQPLPTTSSVVGFEFPQAGMGLPLDVGNRVYQQLLGGPSTEPDNELQDFIDTLTDSQLPTKDLAQEEQHSKATCPPQHCNPGNSRPEHNT